MKEYKFTEPGKSAGFLLFLIRVKIVILIASIVQFLYDIRMYNNIALGHYATEEAVDKAFDTSEPVSTLISAAEILTYIMLLIAFFIWQYRMAANTQLWKINTTQKPHWGLWNFVIPVWSLIKPYTFMRELWNSTEYDPTDPAKWKQLPAPGCIKIWWALYLTGSALSYIIFKIILLKKSETLDDCIALSRWLIFGDIMNICEYFALTAIVSGIICRQKIFQEKLTASVE